MSADAQIDATMGSLLQKVSQLKAVETTNVTDAGGLNDFREALKNLFFNLCGKFSVFDNISKDNIWFDPFLMGSCVAFMHGDTDEKPNDLDIFFCVNKPSYYRAVKLFGQNPNLTVLFFTLEKLISKEKEFVDGWFLTGIEDITVRETTNERQAYLKDNTHWNLILRSAKTDEQFKVGLMAVFPVMNGNFAFDFRHADDIYSPRVGRMPLTVYNRLHRDEFKDRFIHLETLVSHRLKLAWWEPEELNSLIATLPYETIPTSFDGKVSAMIPQSFPSKERFKNWFNSMAGLCYFLMRAKIAKKGYKLLGGIPLHELEETSHISSEDPGTFAIKFCQSESETPHLLTMGELFKHALGCYKNGRQLLCPTCKKRLAIPKIEELEMKPMDAIKQVWTGYADPLDFSGGKLSFGEKPEAFAHPFGAVFEGMNQVLDELEKDGPRRRTHHHSHS